MKKIIEIGKWVLLPVILPVLFVLLIISSIFFALEKIITKKSSFYFH